MVLPQEMPDLSNKDADVQLKTMKDRRTFMFHRLRKQMAVVNDLFELTNIDRMNQEMSAVDQMLNSLIELNIQCTTLFTPEQVEGAIVEKKQKNSTSCFRISVYLSRIVVYYPDSTFLPIKELIKNLLRGMK